MTGQTLSLRHDGWHVGVDPACGGQIVCADWQGVPVLAPGNAGRPVAAQGAGCFPLVPYSNRIRDARFTFAGETISLPPPGYAAPHALHGWGWRSAWTAGHAGGGLELLLVHAPGAWPWHYEAVQRIAVAGNRLAITLTLTNRDHRPMPAGIGLHPYFPRPDPLRLEAPAEGMWETAPDAPGLPVRRALAPASLAARPLDNGFYGWGGLARFNTQTGLEVTLSATPAFGCLVIYTPASEAYFCIEPVSHVNDALNLQGLRTGERVTVLSPGESLSGTMTLTVNRQP